MEKLLKGIMILNLMDGILTMVWLEMGIAKESNPLMASLIEIDYLLFMSVKMGMIISCCLIFWNLRENKLSIIGSKICLLVYICLMAIHFEGIVHLISLNG